MSFPGLWYEDVEVLRDGNNLYETLTRVWTTSTQEFLKRRLELVIENRFSNRSTVCNRQTNMQQFGIAADTY